MIAIISVLDKVIEQYAAKSRTGTAVLALITAWMGSLLSAEVKLVAPDGAAARRFGYSIALSGNTLAVGAPGSALGDGYRGKVYIYRLSNSSWTLQAALTPSDSEPFDYFGSSVALYQDFLLVAAHADTLRARYSGSAYLFQRINGNFVQKAIFRSPAPSSNDLFGKSVAVNSAICAVGAPAAGGAVASSGTVYVYKPDPSSPSGWSPDGKLLPSTSKTNNFFGAAVSVSGNRVVVGTPFKSTSPAGEAYIFEKISGTWTQVKLSPSDGTLSNRFGFAVAIDGNLCAVGAYRDDVADFDVGSVYAFRYDQGKWLADSKLVAADADSGDFFGYSLALYGSFLIVGAPGDNGLYRDSGSIYAFQRYKGVWNLKTKRAVLDQRQLDRFGSSTAVGQYYAMAGSPDKKVNTADKQGSLYVYQAFEDLALPVLLTSFQGKWENRSVVLSWTTESEKDNLGFLLERRSADSPWEKIADFTTHPELIGRGTSSEALTYRFIDHPPTDQTALFYRLGFVNIEGVTAYLQQVQVSNGELFSTALHSFHLYPAFPNPFNPQTIIRYELPAEMHVEAAVFDASGRSVRRLMNAVQPTGSHVISWDGYDDDGSILSAGVYFVRFAAGGLQKTQKIVFVR